MGFRPRAAFATRLDAGQRGHALLAHDFAVNGLLAERKILISVGQLTSQQLGMIASFSCQNELEVVLRNALPHSFDKRSQLASCWSRS